MNLYALDGKVAVITGGASDIGLACAHLMARSGADICIWDPYKDAVDESVKSFSRYGHRTQGATVNVSDRVQVDKAMEDVVASLGRVDIAVCTTIAAGSDASICPPDSDQGRHQAMARILSSVRYPQRAAIRAMKATGGGSVVNVASVLRQVGFATAAAYTAVQHGLVDLTLAAASEHAADRVRVNAVGPGFIATSLLGESLDRSDLEFLESHRALQWLGSPNEVAEIVAWLASDSSSLASGTYQATHSRYARAKGLVGAG